MLDPDVCIESFRKLGIFTGTPVDAYWTGLIGYDYERFVRLRRQQKAFLARYGRQSLLQWGDVEVVDIFNFAADIIALMEREGGTEEIQDG